MTKEKIIITLYNALREATYEQCHNCPSWDDVKYKCGISDNKCFVQRWWHVLNSTKDNLTTSTKTFEQTSH